MKNHKFTYVSESLSLHQEASSDRGGGLGDGAGVASVSEGGAEIMGVRVYNPVKVTTDDRKVATGGDGG